VNLGFERSAQTSPCRQLESQEMLDLMPDQVRANHGSANFTFTSFNTSEIKMHGRGRNTDLATKRLSNASSDFLAPEKLPTEASPLPSNELLVNTTITNHSTNMTLGKFSPAKKDGAGTAMDVRKDDMLTTIASKRLMNDTTAQAFELGGSGTFQPSNHFDS
tara:strand:- start:292 stop:777 length:486 start_codon:yes stop_codon:yes gene_type:complete